MPKKILHGVVVNDKENKTIKVMIERKYQHPLFKKVVKSKKKYSAHDEKNKFKVADKVSIIECKPYSKNKNFPKSEPAGHKAFNATCTDSRKNTHIKILDTFHKKYRIIRWIYQGILFDNYDEINLSW